MKQNLINDILNETLNYTVSKWMIERVPFIFPNLEEYIGWKEKLSLLIKVDSKAIVFIGTSAVGFSLNPEKNLKEFDEESDIDVAVISNYYFDISWFYLRNLGTKFYRLNPREKAAIEDHRKRLIYYGTIATDKIIQIFPFGIDWVNASSEMAKVEPTKGRIINFRIYKDFEALKSYHINGMGKIKDLLLKEPV